MDTPGRRGIVRSAGPRTDVLGQVRNLSVSVIIGEGRGFDFCQLIKQLGWKILLLRGGHRLPFADLNH